jgi:hypothetical protein
MIKILQVTFLKLMPLSGVVADHWTSEWEGPGSNRSHILFLCVLEQDTYLYFASLDPGVFM